MTIVVRKAVLPDDLATLIQFLGHLHDLEHAIDPARQTATDGADSHMQHLIQDAEKNQGLVAIAETPKGESVGMMVCSVETFEGQYLYPSESRVGYISDLWIEPDHRGGSLLDDMIATAEAHFKALGLETLMLSYLVGNDRAAAAYTKRGFQPNEVQMKRKIS
ncbi:MAG: GNAT family N-acetyltransferase [Alphaproteobacteria bacterium]|nr:GNAT family N-acetyltransferase [Alphaproteobacteria bacterium]